MARNPRRSMGSRLPTSVVRLQRSRAMPRIASSPRPMVLCCSWGGRWMSPSLFLACRRTLRHRVLPRRLRSQALIADQPLVGPETTRIDLSTGYRGRDTSSRDGDPCSTKKKGHGVHGPTANLP